MESLPLGPVSVIASYLKVTDLASLDSTCSSLQQSCKQVWEKYLLNSDTVMSFIAHLEETSARQKVLMMHHIKYLGTKLAKDYEGQRFEGRKGKHVNDESWLQANAFFVRITKKASEGDQTAATNVLWNGFVPAISHQQSRAATLALPPQKTRHRLTADEVSGTTVIRSPEFLLNHFKNLQITVLTFAMVDSSMEGVSQSFNLVASDSLPNRAVSSMDCMDCRWLQWWLPDIELESGVPRVFRRRQVLVETYVRPPENDEVLPGIKSLVVSEMVTDLDNYTSEFNEGRETYQFDWDEEKFESGSSHQSEVSLAEEEGEGRNDVIVGIGYSRMTRGSAAI